MTVPARLAAFAVVLATVFAIGSWLGSVTDPGLADTGAGTAGSGMDGHEDPPAGLPEGPAEGAADGPAGGPAGGHGAPHGAPTADAVDGYQVVLDGVIEAGRESTLTLTVRSGGQPVELDPHLGTGGHLAVLRPGDPAHVPAHPIEERGEDGEVRFTVTVPSAGTYRLFFDFEVDGEVHTADFTLEIP